MAEYILKELIAEKEELNSENWEIRSAGISAVKGADANEKTKSVMSEINIDISEHNSHNINDIELTKNDLIITMTRKHSRALILRHPDLADKIFTLKEFSKTNQSESDQKDSKDIIDPFGLSEEVYRKTRNEIKNNIKLMLEKLKEFELKED